MEPQGALVKAEVLFVVLCDSSPGRQHRLRTFFLLRGDCQRDTWKLIYRVSTCGWLTASRR